MADDVQDIAIYTGSEWTSLSELAAGVVDAKLPIESVDGTVKIWSAAADYINFDTGGTNDFKMDPSGSFTAKSRIISKATGTDNVAFGTEDGKDGFAVVASGYPGIVCNGEQVQNWNFSTVAGDYKRYQSTIKARSGPTSYSEIMFLSDDSQNKGLRLLACGSDVSNVAGWPMIGAEQSLGFDSSGVSALLHNGYLIEGSSPNQYTPLVIGCQTRSDLVFMTESAAFITLKPSENEIQLAVPLNAAVVKNDLIVQGQVKTPSITGLADNDASVTLGGQATLKQGDGSEYVPTDSASIATKKIVDDKIWVGTTAQYLAIPIRDILPGTLYCLTD